MVDKTGHCEKKMLEILESLSIQGWLETLGYSLIYAYAAFGFGYFIAKIIKRQRTHA